MALYNLQQTILTLSLKIQLCTLQLLILLWSQVLELLFYSKMTSNLEIYANLLLVLIS